MNNNKNIFTVLGKDSLPQDTAEIERNGRKLQPWD
jgi:hypothetical protein